MISPRIKRFAYVPLLFLAVLVVAGSATDKHVTAHVFAAVVVITAGLVYVIDRRRSRRRSLH